MRPEMKVGRFELHRRSVMTLGQLSAVDQSAIVERLESLSDLPLQDWPARVARRPDVAEPLYVVPVDDSLRVLIFAREGHDPQVADIVRHETLERYATAK
jgi:hypothetical protein